ASHRGDRADRRERRRSGGTAPDLGPRRARAHSGSGDGGEQADAGGGAARGASRTRDVARGDHGLSGHTAGRRAGAGGRMSTGATPLPRRETSNPVSAPVLDGEY